MVTGTRLGSPRWTTSSSAPSSSPRCTRATSSPSTTSTSRCTRARSSGCSARTARARRPPPGMLTTRVIPTGGRALVGGVDVVAHPTAAKQLIGVVPQTQHARPLARRLREPLLPRPVLRDEREDREVGGPPPARAVPAHRPRPGARARAVRRHGAAAHGGAGDHAPPDDPVPRRADRRPRPAEPHRAVGDPRRAPRRRADDPAHHALHGRGRPALRPPRDHRPRPDARHRHARGAQGGRSASTP